MAAAGTLALGVPLAVSAVPAAAAAGNYAVIAKIIEPTSLIAVAVSTGKIYGASPSHNSVTVADAATDEVIGDIPVEGTPKALAVDANGLVYAATPGFISVIDPAQDKVVKTFPGCSSPAALATQAGQLFEACGGAPGTVQVVSAQDGTPVRPVIDLSASPSGIAVTAAGAAYVTLQNAGRVAVIPAGSSVVDHSIPVGQNPTAIAIGPDSATAYVTNAGNPGTVSVIDTVGDKVIGTPIAVGNSPQSVTVDTAGGVAYVTNGASATVSVIDTAAASVIATLQVGSAPSGVAVNPDTHLAYVADSANALVYVIGMPSVVTITTASPLPSGTIAVGYSQQLAASGGVQPYRWSLAPGSSLPDGLTLSSDGVISGTPTAAGTTTFTVQATDSSNPPITTTKPLTLTVRQEAQLQITTASLPDGTVGAAYQQSLAASGGLQPYRWSLAAGSSLPDGLTLSGDGTLSGTPTAAGTTSFTVRVTDGTGATATATLALAISPAPPPGPSPSPAPPPSPSPSPAPGPGGSGNPSPPVSIITGSQLPEATVGVRYAVTLRLDGGIAPYRWAVVRGAPPRGLRLGAATGVLSGVPAAAGTAVFTVQVNDSVGTIAKETLTLMVRASHGRLQIALSHVGPLRRGSTAAYRLRVSTKARSERVTTRIMLPPGLIPVRAADRHWACSARGRHAWVCSRQLLVRAGRPVVLTLRVSVTVVARTVETARATVTAGRARASAVSRTHVWYR